MNTELFSKATISIGKMVIHNKGRTRALVLQNCSTLLPVYVPINSQTLRKNKTLEDAALCLKEQGKSWKFSFRVLSVLEKSSLTQGMHSDRLALWSLHTKGSSLCFPCFQHRDTLSTPAWCCWAQLQIKW